MNVLMYGWEFPPYISGGLGVACHAIVQGLAKKHIKVSLVLPQAVENPTLDKEYVSIIGCDFFKDFDLNHLKQLCLSINIQDISSFLHPYSSCKNTRTSENNHDQHFIEKLKSMEFSGKYGINLLSEVFRYALIAGTFASCTPHDAIHCHDWLTILAGIEAKRRSHKPLIFHVHALEIDRSGEFINHEVFNIEKYGMEKADKIITVSQYTKNMITHHYGIPAEKITVVHNGINHDCYKNTLNKEFHPKMVLFLGRITHQKGPHSFVEIAKKILSKRQDVQFVVVGNGDLMSDMIKHAAAARIGQYIHFTGFFDPDTVKKIYQLADVYVMPSVSEPFGLTCLEALALQTPVVISKQSGAAETLTHALKSDFWDVNDMAGKILALLDHHALRHELLKNSQKELKKLTWDKAANKIIEVYNQLIG